MRLRELWRASPFRLTLLNGAVFAVALMALLGLIYWRTAGYITHQLDAIIVSERDPGQRPGRHLARARAGGGGRRRPGHRLLRPLLGRRDLITGNVRRLPANVKADNTPRTLNEPGLQPGARGLVRRQPWGEQLFVVHDAKVLTGLRDIIVNALVVSGAVILLLGLGAARPAQRPAPAPDRAPAIDPAAPAAFRASWACGCRSRAVATRSTCWRAWPVPLMDETERLLWEVKSVGDNVAHRPAHAAEPSCAPPSTAPPRRTASRIAARWSSGPWPTLDDLLVRFRALTRIGEIERRDRQGQFRVRQPARRRWSRCWN